MTSITASQAKQLLQDRAGQMKSAADKGIQKIKSFATKGRKIIEAEAQKATEKSAEKILGEM